MTVPMRKQHYLTSVFFLFACVVVLLFLLLYFLIDYLWIIIIPVLLLLLCSLLQVMSHKFWDKKKYCPKCNAPISIYSEFCRNCGVRLMKKCPQCGKFLNADLKTCNRCQFIFEGLEPPRPIVQYQMVPKGAPIPKKPNFCTNCGVKLELGDKFDYCTFCGSKIR